mmetsp:Transcript_90511/g.173534  ORF Transcript_90511/g.173534 Transcript_90511/m.173534 type:complete len:239 (-) Transcript_90511:58-774(-)
MQRSRTDSRTIREPCLFIWRFATGCESLETFLCFDTCHTPAPKNKRNTATRSASKMCRTSAFSIYRIKTALTSTLMQKKPHVDALIWTRFVTKNRHCNDKYWSNGNQSLKRTHTSSSLLWVLHLLARFSSPLVPQISGRLRTNNKSGSSSVSRRSHEPRHCSKDARKFVRKVMKRAICSFLLASILSISSMSMGSNPTSYAETTCSLAVSQRTSAFLVPRATNERTKTYRSIAMKSCM